mmetsp:Transcript_75318/g.92543  ORF Transcript_75318/g.92543 Transcript_75318/m.92543 type:complete len:93 (+) Transcript_75318:31-309(+)
MAKATRRPKILASLALALGCSVAFVGPVPSPAPAGPLARQAVAEPAVVTQGGAFQALTETPLRRAVDGAEVQLTSLWKDDEQVVVAFLRHFG